MARVNNSFCSRMGLEKQDDMSGMGGKLNKYLKQEFKSCVDNDGYNITQAMSHFAQMYVDASRKKRGLEPFVLSEVYERLEKAKENEGQ